MRKEAPWSRKRQLIVVVVLGFCLGCGLALLKLSGLSVSKQQDVITTLNAENNDLKLKLDKALKEMDQIMKRHNEMQKVLMEKGSEESLDRHAVWGPSEERDEKNPELGKLLREVAINDEVMVAVSNINYARPGGMLDLWMDGVKRAGVRNALVVALDEETKENVEKRGFKAFRMTIDIPDSQKNAGSNHAVSALKFRILKQFMELGYSVLLSDVDIITLRNPFDSLERDSDVESMSDGWDEGKAYGYNDVLVRYNHCVHPFLPPLFHSICHRMLQDDESMGWARYAHSMRIFVFNSGLFYLRPTIATMALLDKLIYRVESENGWDQALFNECIFFPNSPKNKVGKYVSQSS